MRLENLIGYKLLDIDDNKMIVKLDGQVPCTIKFIRNDGDCCGYTVLKTLLYFDKDASNNPVITNIDKYYDAKDEEASVIITFFGGNKKLANIKATAGSASGWEYGAVVKIKCQDLELDEEIIRW